MKRLFIIVGALLISACGSDSSNPAPQPSTTSQTKIIGLVGNLAFGSVAVGSRSASALLTISNSGTSTLTVTGMLVPGGAYSANWTSGTIPPGGSQPVSVAFTPTTAGTFNGSLIVNGDQTSGTNSIAISGVAAAVHADIQPAASGTSVCFTGLCTSFTFAITNAGPGCATNVQVITRFYGGDGNGPQLGIDVPMILPGGSLSSTFFRVGTAVTVANSIPFNDVRCAHTVFRPTITWTDVACQ